MKSILRRYFVLTLLLLTTKAMSQVYPVQGNAALIPPYSLKLTDYANSVTERLAVNLVMNDVLRPELRVRLRVRIEGQNVKLETKPEYIGSPITLQGGVGLRLTNIDLGEYFNPNNLNFSGISQSEFLKTGSLPEGFYQFCFEVLEYNRGVKISNTICAPAWLILNDPPIVNAPRNGEKLRPLTPQNIAFQWTPRHTGSPNSAFTTEYDFKLVELWPANRNPNDAILTQPPIYEATVNSTMLIYGPDATPLEPGRHYAFRVKARSIAGVEELDLFKNNGYSEVVTFIYGDACEPPLNIIAEPPGATRFVLNWDAAYTHTGYNVRYRQAGSNTGWYGTNTVTPDFTITSLKPSTKYEYQVMATCGGYESAYSNVATITTTSTPLATYSCGLPLENFNLDPSQLLPTMKPGDILKAGDFEVTVSKVSGGNGIFTGEGAVVVPYLNQVKAKAVFSNIIVNTESRMVKGTVDIIGGAVEVVPQNVLNALDKLSEVLDAVDSAMNIASSFLNTDPPDPGSFVADTLITIKGEIVNVFKDPIGGGVVVVDSQGNRQTLPPGKDVALVDEKGHGVIVNKAGNKTNTSAPIATATANREYNLKLNFLAGANTKYGLDKKEIEQLAKEYEIINKDHYVAWKAVAANGTDEVAAQLEGSVDKSKLTFEQEGQALTTTPGLSGSQINVNVKGSSAGVKEILVAKVAPSSTGGKEQVVGQINVVNYDAKSYKLKLIPVNGATYPGDKGTLQTELTKIYGQAVVSWNVEIQSNLTVAGIADPFDDGESGLLSNYTADMKSVIKAYPSSFEPDTYYLFLIKKPKTVTKLGYMPRSKQAGFIFLEPHNNDVAALTTTIAHELGHGAFHLKHLWTEKTTVAEKSTDNLMDYKDGRKLLKFQWDHIHNPEMVVGLFESDEAGQNLITNTIPKALLNGTTFNFLTPSGKKITLPQNCIANFNYGISSDIDHLAPIGYLHSFKIQEGNEIVNYSAKVINNIFNGYYCQEKKKDYDDQLTGADKNDNAILFVPDAKGYRFIRFKINGLIPYTSGEQMKTYSDFPIQPYDKSIAEKSSELFVYSTIGGLKNNIKEQWTLHQDSFEELLTKHSQKPEHAYVVKIVELKTAYPSLFKSFTICWDDWGTLIKVVTSGSPTTGISTGTTIECNGKWDLILKADKNLHDSWETDPIPFYKRFINEFVDFINKGREAKQNYFNGSVVDKWKKSDDKVKFRNDLLLVLQSSSNEEIKNILDCSNRMGSIAILNSQATTELFEQEVVRLVKYVPTDQIDCLLDTIKSTSPLDKDSKSLVGLMEDIHDSHLWYGENNFKEFVIAISQLVLRSTKYYNSYLLNAIESDNQIFFYDASFWKRVSQTLTSQYGYQSILQETKIQLKEDCSIKMDQLLVMNGLNVDVNISKTWDDPFTLVSIVNNTHIDLLQDLSNGPKGAVMPVLMLEYMDWKGTEKFTVDGLTALLDVASTASGVGNLGHLRHLTKLQKAARIFDLAAGVSGIASGLFEEQIKDIPELQATINLIQVASLVTNFRAALKSGGDASRITALVREANEGNQITNITKALDGIESQAATLKNITNKTKDGFLQKVEIYAFLKKLKADAAIDPSANKGIIDQIFRIESKVGGVDDFVNSLKTLNNVTDFTKYAKVDGWLKEISNTSIEEILKTWDDEMLKLLDADLASNTMANELKTLLSTTDDIEIWRNLKNNPEQAFQLAEESASWNKWSKANFFKTVTKTGRNLNTKIIGELQNKSSNLFKELESKIGKSLQDYNLITEVPLATSGGYMKADVVFIKVDNYGKIQDVIVIENKLSQTTNFTTRQKEGFGAILSVDGKHTMDVKYAVPGLDPQHKKLEISKANIYRIYDHGTEDISNVKIEKITKLSN